MNGSQVSRQPLSQTGADFTDAHVADTHLTDAQFSDLLAGDSLESGAEAHLAQCSFCQSEAELITGSLAAFNTLGTAWAEREAPHRVHSPSRWRLRLGLHPAWSAGLAAVAASVALAVGLHLPRHPARMEPLVSVAQSEGRATTGSDLAADNRLLASIDQELSYTPQPSVPLSDLKGAGHRAPAKLGEAVAD